MHYVIVYRDGKVSPEGRTWERTLFFLGICKNIAWAFKPVLVVEAPEGYPLEERN